MNEHKNIISAFYTAFEQQDAERMVSHYADDVTFDDPAFGTLHGEHAKNMWRMLITSQKGKDFHVVSSDIVGTQSGGTAHWQATYTFSKTGRKVVNEIDATFIIEDGKIIKHTDTFNLHRWAKQAMGFKGLLLGGTAFFKRQLQSQTNAMLSRWEAKA